MAAFCDFKIHGENLDAHDWNGKSDPFFIIKTPKESSPNLNSQGTRQAYKDVYVSEIIPKDLNPVWRPFRVDFYELCGGDKGVELLIECYDWDRIGSSDFIGSFKVRVKDILNTKKTFDLVSKKDKKAGEIVIESRSSRSIGVCCDFKARAIELDAKDSSGTSDPYFVLKVPCDIHEHESLLPFAENIIYPSPPFVRGRQSHPTTPGYREIYESSVVLKTLNPEWKNFRISYYDLCRARPDTKLLLECYDYNQLLSNVLIGSTEVSVRSLLESVVELPLLLLSPNGTKAGTFMLECIPTALLK